STALERAHWRCTTAEGQQKKAKPPEEDLARPALCLDTEPPAAPVNTAEALGVYPRPSIKGQAPRWGARTAWPRPLHGANAWRVAASSREPPYNSVYEAIVESSAPVFFLPRPVLFAKAERSAEYE